MNLISNYSNQNSSGIGTKVVQWSRIDCLKLDLHMYGQLICNRSAKASQWRKDYLLSK